MKTDKLARLQAVGWQVDSAENFLQLSDEEARLVALMYGDRQGIASKSLQEIEGLSLLALEESKHT
ncbi:MAG: hypothetical protein Q8O64_02785 [Sideroxyarcus sp.]|nr:hypothetical protein [Sideroxyarcus sp.]